jgi:hypothetical protein
MAIQLLSLFTSSSQEVFESFKALASTWLARERFMYTDGGSVRICWVPGHTQIPENKAADQAAKKEAAMNPPPSSRHSYALLRRRAKTDAIAALQRHWQSTAPKSYQDLWITTSPWRPAELKLPRPLLARILAACTGHGDFAGYHERFNHEDAHLLCHCEARKSLIHFFFCCVVKRHMPRPPGAPSTAIPYLLGTPKGAVQLDAWLSKTRFFEDICPRYPPSQQD